MSTPAQGQAQRTNRIYSGIDHIALQDQAVTESMGAIGFFEMPTSVEWQQAYADKMKTADRVLKEEAAPAEAVPAK